MCNMTADELFEKYSDVVYRVAFMTCGDRCEAEDIVQEVFVRYLKRRPEFENDVHAKAWFIRVAVNCTKSLQTSAWKRKVVSVEEYYDSENEPSTAFDREESELYEVIRSLPQKYSIVIYLRYYEEYMEFDDRNPQIIFNMAMIYKTKGDEETSDQLFGQVIMNFDDEELAAKAKEERGY